MPLRSSLARSLQYAMANMADIKTPLCALQPTPAIPHTASRSGAGTRARRGGERGLERAPARSARPANPRHPPAALSAPGCSRPPPSAGLEAAGAEWALGRREPTPRASSRCPRSLTFSRSLARSQRRLLTGEGAGKLCAPHACFPNGHGGRIGWAALLPGTGELRHLSPPLAAGIGAGAMPEATAVGGGVRSGAPGALRTDGSLGDT